MNCNFVPIEIGAGDWVDPKIFYSKNNKRTYDIVMVGNWSKNKRHKLLFENVSKMKNKKNIKIVLIGYPSQGRKKEDVISEAKIYNLINNITLFENIKPNEVSQILGNSKVNILLSKGEGANRGIYEGLFSGNVLILYKNNRGVNKKIINENTGYLADENDLHMVIEKALSDYDKFNTANWAISNTGYLVTSAKLNNLIKKLALLSGEIWTKDIVSKRNVPNGLYSSDEDRLSMRDEYKKLLCFTR
jgi:glycosyltransferase involved in cell wall biosynthesis